MFLCVRTGVAVRGRQQAVRSQQQETERRLWVKFPGNYARQHQPQTAGQPQPSQQREVVSDDDWPLMSSLLGFPFFIPVSLLTCLCLRLTLLSPDGSYTEDHSAELHFKSRSSEFDDDFDDEEPLPSIGTCKSLYPFQGTLQHLNIRRPTLQWHVKSHKCTNYKPNQSFGMLETS